MMGKSISCSSPVIISRCIATLFVALPPPYVGFLLDHSWTPLLIPHDSPYRQHWSLECFSWGAIACHVITLKISTELEITCSEIHDHLWVKFTFIAVITITLLTNKDCCISSSFDLFIMSVNVSFIHALFYKKDEQVTIIGQINNGKLAMCLDQTSYYPVELGFVSIINLINLLVFQTVYKELQAQLMVMVQTIKI